MLIFILPRFSPSGYWFADATNKQLRLYVDYDVKIYIETYDVLYNSTC